MKYPLLQPGCSQGMRAMTVAMAEPDDVPPDHHADGQAPIDEGVIRSLNAEAVAGLFNSRA